MLARRHESEPTGPGSELESNSAGRAGAPAEWLQISASGYPVVPSPPFATLAGTPYLRAPGIALISSPSIAIDGLKDFLGGFDPQLQFPGYLEDRFQMPPGAQLCKAAGQLCYMSFGPKRTLNRDASRYFANIFSSGHGSVLEHACFSLLFYGISRSVTHELVRHRAGFAFSQVSQRYVSGRVLRFVERPEYAEDHELHADFERRIDAAAVEYDRVAARLIERQRAGVQILTADAKTDLRKKVQQAARSVLPNETEAPICVTANARAWRHFLEMRANPHAEIEIRSLAFRAYLCLVHVEPVLFGDYGIVPLADGTFAVDTANRKV
ncbi:MAG TPA: FAD-dependent thymidylate synthase [Chthonomonadales bacterium]|nr:FAD-dependent thymidylate synthase [Chthonomonadales bacterium]